MPLKEDSKKLQIVEMKEEFRVEAKLQVYFNRTNSSIYNKSISNYNNVNWDVFSFTPLHEGSYNNMFGEPQLCKYELWLFVKLQQ